MKKLSGKTSSKARQRALMRKMYVAGKSVQEIAVYFQIDVRSVYYNRKVDFDERGLDWDVLRLETTTSETEFRETNKRFLTRMFELFEDEQRRLAEVSDAAERLTLLERYASCYTKLVRAGKSTEPLGEIQEVVTRTVKLLSELAMTAGRPDIVEWLVGAMEEIEIAVRKEFDGKRGI